MNTIPHWRHMPTYYNSLSFIQGQKSYLYVMPLNYSRKNISFLFINLTSVIKEISNFKLTLNLVQLIENLI